MIRTTIGISGMACGMCEAHISEALRNAFSVKKAAVSRKKGTAVILSEAPLDSEKLRGVIQQAGYVIRYITEENIGEKGLFRRLRQKIV